MRAEIAKVEDGFDNLTWVLPSFWCKRRCGVRTSFARRIGGIEHCFRSAPIAVLAAPLKMWSHRPEMP